jgi:hypothetical protein
MSLQHAAKHLAAHGRGKDTELIHMDKGEIASLQQIAKANGGSLTINPHTGLPEAGFLSAMLPMIAGAALTGLSGGVINPMTAGFMVGGLRTAQSGSLKKGIMAGFGAYGGAGLAESFGAAGAGSTTTLDGSAIANPPPAPVTPTPTPATPASNVIDVSGSSLPQVGGPIEPSSIVKTPLESMTNVQDPYASAGFESSGRPPGFETTPDVTGRSLNDTMYSDYGGATKGIPTQTYEVAPKSFADLSTPSERISAMGRGASFENAGNYISANPKSSLAAATQVAYDMRKGPPKPAEPDKDMGQRYSFTGGKIEPTPVPDVPTYEDMLTKQGNYGRQRQYFNSPTYTAISPTAAKDLYNFAGGGMPVEQMSNQAAMGANTMYPMANMATSSFATPYQSPVSTNMLAPTSDSPVGMNGEPSMQGTRMAEGGEAEGAVAESRPSYTYDPQTRKYTAGSSMGGASSAPQDFGASAAAGLDSFSAGVARDGMTTPMGSYIPPSSNGIPSYAYNPQTRQYIQMADGGIPRYRIGGDLDIQNAPDDQPVGPIGRLLGMTRKREQDANPGLGYMYNQDDQQYVQQQASGGISDARYNLGGYSDGGRLLRGPGDGVSDSIPAVIGKKQPARLADGEFVVPARIVSELGNGSTEAGARKLYAMMDRIQASRKNTVGKGKVAKNNRADKYLPA